MWGFFKKYSPVGDFEGELFTIKQNKKYKHHTFDIDKIDIQDMRELIRYCCVEDVRLYSEDDKNLRLIFLLIGCSEECVFKLKTSEK